MADFNGKSLLELSDSELNYFVKRYRLITLSLLIVGAIITIYLIYQKDESDFLVLIYLIFMTALLPIILKSNALHRELKSRYYQKRRKEKDKRKTSQITLKME